MPNGRKAVYRNGEIEAEKTAYVPFDVDEISESVLKNETGQNGKNQAMYLDFKLKNSGCETETVELGSIISHSIPRNIRNYEWLKERRVNKKKVESTEMLEDGRLLLEYDTGEALVYECSEKYQVRRKGEKKTEIAVSVSVPEKSGKEVRQCVSYFSSRAEAMESGSRLVQVERGEKLNDVSEVMLNPKINELFELCKNIVLRDEIRCKKLVSFTNDPKAGNPVEVERDASYRNRGLDHFLPEAAGAHIENARKRMQKKSGKIVEYIRLNSGAVADYGLNVNDNTPLIISSIWHHYLQTKDENFLEKTAKPVIKKAIKYILSQKDEKTGLVWTKSNPDCRGGARNASTWANIIDDREFTGAVTEINAQVYSALLAGRELAKVTGDERFGKLCEEEGGRLRENINKHLLSQKTGVYAKNIDDFRRKVHEEVRAEPLIEALISGVSNNVGGLDRKLVERLHARDVWTEYGPRTESTKSPYYDKDCRQYEVLMKEYRRLLKAGKKKQADMMKGKADIANAKGLEGGVWLDMFLRYCEAPLEDLGLSKTERRKYAVEMERVMERISDLYVSRNPEKTGSAPLQAPEWLDGSTLRKSRYAMEESPWTPSKVIDITVRKLLGVDKSTEGLVLNEPRFRENYAGIRNYPYAGGRVSLVIDRAGKKVYTTSAFEKLPEGYAQEIVEELPLRLSEGRAIGFRSNDRSFAFVQAENEGDVRLDLGKYSTNLHMGRGESRLLEMPR